MKRILGAAAVISAVLCLAACSSANLRQKLCDGYWESSVDILEFTEDGRVLHNFESPEDSVSYYKLDGKKINLYTEEGEEYGITFDISIDGDTLMLGKAEYTRHTDPEVSFDVSDSAAGDESTDGSDETDGGSEK